MKLLIALLFLVGFSNAMEAGIRSYEGYRVLTVHATNDDHASVIKTLFDSDEYDFWTSPLKRGATDIMVNPDQLKLVLPLFQEHGMGWDIKIENVESLIQEEHIANQKIGNAPFNWTRYMRYDEVEQILNTINNPVATVSNIGTTTEGRTIYAVKFSSGGAPKKSVLIDAMHHAREWVAGASATWMINELATNSDAYADVLAQIDIYIIPYLNIDGYEWSHTNDRMWRKTRSVNAGSTCRGCDPNRNYAFHFGGESTSPNPCSDIFHGGSAFREPETRALRDFIVGKEGEGVRFVAYLTFHSYAQQWLLPWGYTQGVYPPDFPEQLSLGNAAIAALNRVHGTVYETGQGADLLYGVGGASDDWCKDHGIKYTTTVEMRDTGSYGFILPPSQIIPNAQEVWAAVQEYFKRVIETP